MEHIAMIQTAAALAGLTLLMAGSQYLKLYLKGLLAR